MFSRSALKRPLMAGSLALGLLTLSKTSNVENHLKELAEKQKKANDVYTLNGQDYKEFPWVPNRALISSYEDWEMRKVAVKGLL